MDNKKLGLGLLAVTGACWIVTMIGMRDDNRRLSSLD
jgi:hypothetical protein